MGTFKTIVRFIVITTITECIQYDINSLSTSLLTIKCIHNVQSKSATEESNSDLDPSIVRKFSKLILSSSFIHLAHHSALTLDMLAHQYKGFAMTYVVRWR